MTEQIKIESLPPHIDAAEIDAKAAESAWPNIEPLGYPPPPAFPVNSLPPVLAQWVAEESEATQTPPDMAALLSLATCSFPLSKRVVVEAWEGYCEPVNLYVAAILDPANRKSAVFSDATKPLRAVERELMNEREGDVAAEQSERRQAEKRLAKLEKQAAENLDRAKREAASAEAGEVARQLQAWPEPGLPKLIIDDATSERLAVLLQANGERIASMSAEGGVFDLMAGKYAKSGTTDMEVYLKGHSGDALNVQRMCREPVNLEAPALTMALAIQPEVIRGIAGSTAFRGRGLLGRFMYAIPRSWIGKRKIGTPPVCSMTADAYAHVVWSLSKLKAGVDNSPRPLRLDAAACKRFKFFCEWIEHELDAGDLETMRDWGGKLAGLTLRLAGIIHSVVHVAEDFVTLPIESSTVESAERIARWAIPHAAQALELLAASESGEMQDDAAYILRWLRSQVPIAESFDRRDIHRHGQRRFNRQPERLDFALALLERTFYISRQPGQSMGGKVTYAVSPKFRADMSVAVDNDDASEGRARPDPHLSPLSTLGRGSGDGRQRLTL